MRPSPDNNPVLTVSEWLVAAGHSGLPRLDAELVLAHALNKPRSWLYAWPEIPLPANARQRADALWHRRVAGEPLAYLTGSKEFYGLALKVSPDTLIPRPETEALVDAVLELHRQHPVTRVLDLGAGTGAIALAVKSLLPDCDVWATDASRKALRVASENAQKLNLALRLFCGDWFAALPTSAPRFDVIISNPPYIDPTDSHLAALRHEPASALVAEDGGLADLRQLIRKAPDHLRDGGWLILEHGHDQGQVVREAMLDAGYHRIETRPDLAGLDRYTLGRRP